MDPFMMPPAIRPPEEAEPPESPDPCELCSSGNDVQFFMNLMVCKDCRVEIVEGRLLNE